MNNRLWQFVHHLDPGDVAPETLRLAGRCLLDLIGVGAGGIATPLSATIRDHAAAHFAAGNFNGKSKGARMLLDGRTVSPAGAALAGAMTIDSLDAHDGHRETKGHVGCGVLPAALALAEAEAINDGREFLTWLVLGYEVGSRAGMALHRTAGDYHTSGAWVAIACAAIGARALKLDQDQTRHALGIAEYHGPRSPMMRCIEHPTMVKDGSGWGAMAGVSAAYLAGDGFTGAPALTVEGDDVAELWDDLGRRWRIGEQYFKPHPICRWAQPPVAAVLALKERHGLAADDIERIEVATFEEARRLRVARPANTEEAQYSLPFPVAWAAVHGSPGPEAVSTDGLEDRQVLRLSESMVVTEDAAYSGQFPARRLARVTLVLKDGQRISSPTTEAVGEPDAPLSDEEISAKYRRFATPLLGPARAQQVESAVAALQEGAPLGRLTDLLYTDYSLRGGPESG